VRTPIGSFGGSLSSFSASQLGSITVKEALNQAGIEGSQVGECFFGNVVSAGMGQAPARQAILFAGLPDSIPCTTVNKVCASGMKSIMFAAQSIQLGQQNTIIAGGMESMSNIPYYVPKARNGYRYGHGELLDGVLKDGLWDVYNDSHMGMAAEHCSKTENISRKEQDDYAIESYTRAADAHKSGAFDAEIVAVEVKSRKETKQITDDEEYHRVDFSKVPNLRPAFDKEGTVTAANASSLNDGSSALVVMSLARAQDLGLKPLAKIVGYGDAARKPIEFTMAPADAIPIALRMAGVSIKDIDFWEINEAFSVVALANMKRLNLDHKKVNVNGGAVGLGHPIGSSGARIVTTLTHLLRNQDKKYGCAAICNGGGGASAIVLEKC
jgi:acetyl-CoA C-acetyltransferase